MTSNPLNRLNLVEIAKLAGVSKSTVSRVLLNQPRVAAETRARVEHIMKAHNFQPSLFARGLAGGKTGLIGVLARWMESGFTAEVIRGINDEVKKRGGHLLCTFAPGIDEYIAMWRRFVGGGQVDGAILIAPPVDLYEQHVTVNDRPTVLCSSAPENNTKGWGNVGAIKLHNQKAMACLVEHLVAKGYKRLVHLAGAPDNFDSRERCETFNKTVALHKGVTGSILQGAWTTELARTVMRQYIDSHRQLPDAYLAFNDMVALGVMEELKERNISVPEQAAVTGWDDIPFARYAGLTTVHLPMVEMGWESARLLFQKMDQVSDVPISTQTTFDMPVMIRQTSGGEASIKC